MGRQLIAMGMGMGIMTGGQHRFCLRVVRRVGMRVVQGVVPVLLIMAFPVLAGMRPDVGQWVTGVFFGFVSR
jgi:hypothetical protein